MDPGPNLFSRASLRRVVTVIFKAGCEERRRNHSCPISYLDVRSRIPRVDSADDSTYLLDCRNSESIDVARRVAVRRPRTRTQSPSYRSTGTSRLQEFCLQVCFSLVLSERRECTASHVFQGTDRQSRSPPENAVSSEQEAVAVYRPSALFGTTDFSERARFRARHPSFSNLRACQIFLCRAQWRRVP